MDQTEIINNHCYLILSQIVLCFWINIVGDSVTVIIRYHNLKRHTETNYSVDSQIKNR